MLDIFGVAAGPLLILLFYFIACLTGWKADKKWIRLIVCGLVCTFLIGAIMSSTITRKIRKNCPITTTITDLPFDSFNATMFPVKVIYDQPPKKCFIRQIEKSRRANSIWVMDDPSEITWEFHLPKK